MSLPTGNHESFFAMQRVLKRGLIIEKGEILNRQIKLAEDFLTYALNKLENNGKAFEVTYRLLNDSETLSYDDLKIGDSFLIKAARFKYDPQTEMIIDYKRMEFREIKQPGSFDDLLAKLNQNKSGAKIRRYFKPRQSVKLATEFEQRKINVMMIKKANKIVKGIFKGDLVFDDHEFRTLIATNIALQKELERIEARIEALNLNNKPNTGIEQNKTV